jgi:hypothetical protein
MAGEWYEREVNCDSEFMLKRIPLVGAAMREKYHWVPMETPLYYLVMDNAGGHDMNDAIANYVHTMKELYNIEIIHQIPRGPEMNSQNLGMWMSLQSFVEKKHGGKPTDVAVLVRTIQEAWDHFDETVFSPVYARWMKVLDLIIANHGDNALVDCH